MHYQRILEIPQVREIIQESKDLPSDEMLSSMLGQNALLFYILNKFEEWGRQVIRLGPVMTETFEDMSISNITPDMVRTPYPCFYLHLPHSEAHVVRLKDDHHLPLEGVYVLDTGDNWYFALIGHGDRQVRDTLIVYEWPMQKWIDSGEEFETFVRKHYGTYKPKDAEQPIMTMTYVMHTCLYIISQNSDTVVEEPTKFKKLQKKWEKASSNRKKSIEEQMARVTPFRTTHVAPRAEHVVAHLSHQERQSRRAHMVHAHWKRQRHGKGLEKVKVLYIQPYLRGDGELPEDVRIYKTS